MRRSRPMSIGELWSGFVEENPTRMRRLAEARIPDLWPEVVGPGAASLTRSLTMRNGVVDVLSQWGITVKVTASDQLLIPKYNGTVEYQYAKPIPADEGGEEAVG